MARPPVPSIPLAAAIGIVCAGLVYFSVYPADASVSSDDGAYVLAARAINEGDWSVPHVVSGEDPDGALYPFRNAVVTDQGFFPYARRPIWVIALAGADALGGVMGLHLLVLLAAGAGIAGTGLLGRVAGSAPSGALASLVMLLSPLTYHALQLWGHAAVVALLSLVYAGAAAAIARPSANALPALALAVTTAAALAVAVHASALPFVAGVVVVLAVHGVRVRRAAPLVMSAMIGSVAAVVHIGSGRIGAAITGGTSEISGRSDSSLAASSRVEGLLDTFVTHPRADRLTTIIALVAVGLTAGSVVVARRKGRTIIVLLGTAAGCWIVRSSIDADAMATGLLAAWPVALLAGVRPWRQWSSAERHLAVAVLIGAAIVALTQYDQGGGLNWGGRFLSGAIPVLAVLVAGGLTHISREAQDGRVIVVVALVLAVVTTGASLRADATIRTRHDRVASLAVDGQQTPVVLTGSEELPRGAWRTVDRIDWLLVAPDRLGGIAETISILRAADITEFTVFRLDPEDYETLTGRDASEQPLEGELVRLDR